jgi:hypothetical protein
MSKDGRSGRSGYLSFDRDDGVVNDTGNAAFSPHGPLWVHSTDKEINMNFNLIVGPLASLIAGILILVMPKLLNYIVAIYLIVIGLIGLFGAGSFHLR